MSDARVLRSETSHGQHLLDASRSVYLDSSDAVQQPFNSSITTYQPNYLKLLIIYHNGSIRKISRQRTTVLHRPR
jgi:hypothetical protein